MKVCANKGVIRVDLKKIMAGGWVSGQPENPPGYTTEEDSTSRMEWVEKNVGSDLRQESTS